MIQSLRPYLAEVLRRLEDTLGENLEGLYIQGSCAHNAFREGLSDLDLIAICAEPLADNMKTEVNRCLLNSALPVPASGLELVVVTAESAKSADPAPAYELMILTGPNWPDSLETSGRASELLIDFGICRQKGIALKGPAPLDVFAEPDPLLVRQALVQAMTWHRAKILDTFHDPDGQNSILNACRALLYHSEGRFASKDEGGEWFLSARPGCTLVQSALAKRAGVKAPIPEITQVDDFLRDAIERLDNMRA